jgi:hypothetical protein
MKIETEKNKMSFVLMLVCSVLLAGLLCAKLVGYFITSTRAGELLRQTAVQEKEESDNAEVFIEDSKRIVEELKRKNLFTPAVARECPVREVTGIMGSEALISGKWYKVGERIDDAIISVVEPSYIKVKWEGGEKTFVPSNTANKVQQATGKRLGAAVKVQDNRKGTETMAAAAEGESKAVQAKEDTFGWMGVELTETQRQKLEVVWNRMPEQVRTTMKAEWSALSEEEKKRSLQELEQLPDDQIERMLNTGLGQTR